MIATDAAPSRSQPKYRSAFIAVRLLCQSDLRTVDAVDGLSGAASNCKSAVLDASKTIVSFPAATCAASTTTIVPPTTPSETRHVMPEIVPPVGVMSGKAAAPLSRHDIDHALAVAGSTRTNNRD